MSLPQHTLVAEIHRCRLKRFRSGCCGTSFAGSPETRRMLRTGTRGYDVLVSLHHMPNYTRVILPPMAGLDGAGGWRELDLTFLPVDDLTNRWFITNLVGADGAAREDYLAKRNTYCGQRAAIGPAEDLAREVREGRVRFQDI